MFDKEIKEKLHYRNFIKNINSLYLSLPEDKLIPLIEQQFLDLSEKALSFIAKQNQFNYLFIFDEIRFNKIEHFHLNILVLVLFDQQTDLSLPIVAKIYHENEVTNKHVYFREMLQYAYDQSFSPTLITASVWYSSLDNLKLIRALGWYWVIFLKPNRRINMNQILGEIDFSEDILMVHLKGYGWISIFKVINQRGEIEYAGTNLSSPSMNDVEMCLHVRNVNLLCHRVRRHGVPFRSMYKNNVQRLLKSLETVEEKE